MLKDFVDNMHANFLSLFILSYPFRTSANRIRSKFKLTLIKEEKNTIKNVRFVIRNITLLKWSVFVVDFTHVVVDFLEHFIFQYIEKCSVTQFSLLYELAEMIFLEYETFTA